MLKKGILSLVVILGIVYIISTNYQSTSLDQVTIEEIKIGDALPDIEDSKYIEMESLSSVETAKYDPGKVVLAADEDSQVSYTFGFFGENDISIENNSDIQNIQDIHKLLGGQYEEHWLSKQENLKTRTYMDNSNGVQLNIAYQVKGGKLITIEMFKMSK